MTEPQNPFGDMPEPPVAPDPAQAQAQAQQAQAQAASQTYQNTYGQPQQPGSQAYTQGAEYGQAGAGSYGYGQGAYQGQQVYSGYTQSATGQYTPGYQQPPYQQGYQQSPYQQAYQQPVAPAPPVMLYPMTETDRNLRLVAFIFNILSLVSCGIFIIPLAWMIPMCIISWGIYKGTKANTVAFGVCTLLFLNFVGGILLLCSNKDR